MKAEKNNSDVDLEGLGTPERRGARLCCVVSAVQSVRLGARAASWRNLFQRVGHPVENRLLCLALFSLGLRDFRAGHGDQAGHQSSTRRVPSTTRVANPAAISRLPSDATGSDSFKQQGYNSPPMRSPEGNREVTGLASTFRGNRKLRL